MIDIRPSGASERWAEHDLRRWPTTRSHRALPPASQCSQRADLEAQARQSRTAWHTWADCGIPVAVANVYGSRPDCFTQVLE